MLSIVVAALLASKAEIAPNTYKITVTGFKCLQETIDNPFDIDGIGDEVYLVVDSAMIGPGGKAYGISRKRTVVYGDTHNQLGRIQAGHRSPSGGLKAGDRYPDFEIEKSNPRPGSDILYRTTPSFTGKLPLLVGYFKLESGKDLLAICPSVWESDGIGSNYGRYTDAIAAAWKDGWEDPSAHRGSPTSGANRRTSNLPSMPVDLVGDYPIGTDVIRVPAGVLFHDNYTYTPKMQLFSLEGIEEEMRRYQTPPRPSGTLEIQFIDSDRRNIVDRHTGNAAVFSTGYYVVYVSIERV